MATFYTGVDRERYDAGNKFVPMDQFLLDYKTPTTNVEEEVTTSYGIPNTNAFINSGGGGGGGAGSFDPYTAQPSGSYITNRTNFGNTGYIQGTEPEENYMDKIGGLVKTGIGMAIPGANFLMNMIPSRENRLSATDNAFIDQQLGIKEQNIHGFGNLENQDRYGYNKVSAFGNYADVIAERVAIANERIAAGKELRDIDRYYMEKEKEQEEIDKQIEFNDFMNQRLTANKIREGIEKGTINPEFNIHSDGDNKNITTNQTQTSGDGYTGSGDFANVDNTGKDYGPHSKGDGNKSSGTTSGYQGKTGSHHYKRGGLVSIL